MMRSEDAETVNTTLESLFRSLDTARFSPYIVFRYYVQLQRFKEAVEFLWRSGSVHMKIDALHLGLAMSSATATASVSVSAAPTDSYATAETPAIASISSRLAPEISMMN